MGSGLQPSPFYLSPLHHLCKTINVPVVYMAQDEMILMWKNTLQGSLPIGWGGPNDQTPLIIL
jgi:hypothetical protein